MPGGKVRIIGVPMDLGQDRRGVDMGPSALRVAGLNAHLRALGYTVEDAGNLSVRVPEEMPVGEKRAKYLAEIADTCKELAVAVGRALEDGCRPLVLGGDHSIAIGSHSGVAAHFLDETLAVEDDHAPFLRSGVAAALLIDFDYPPWHTAEDTLDKVSARSLEIVGGVLLEALPAIEERLTRALGGTRP